MKRRRTQAEVAIAGIDILPLINVSLILVVVLMITSPMLNQPNIEVDLPAATTTETRERNITITYSKDRRVGVNTKVVTFNSMVQEVKRKMGDNTDKLIIIRGDKEVPFGEIEVIMEKLRREIGANRIAIAIEQKENVQ